MVTPSKPDLENEISYLEAAAKRLNRTITAEQKFLSCPIETQSLRAFSLEWSSVLGILPRPGKGRPSMVLVLSSSEVCPKCRKALMQGSVEAHPSRRDIAYHNFECADCGPIKTKVLSLKSGEPPPELPA
jgi:hypothetical protein